MNQPLFEPGPDDITLTPWDVVENPTEEISDEEVYGDESPPSN